METIIREAKTMTKISSYWLKKRAKAHNLGPEYVRRELVNRGIIDNEGFVL